MRSRYVIGNSALMLLLLGASAVWAQTPAVPLGDLVKQPKPTRKAARVITNDDMPHHPPSAAAEPAPDFQDKEAKDADAKEKSASLATGNAVLSQRIADLKDAEAAEEQIIKKFEDKLQGPGVSESERQAYTESVNRSKATLDSYRQQLAVLEATVQNVKAAAQADTKPSENKQPESNAPKPATEELRTPE